MSDLNPYESPHPIGDEIDFSPWQFFGMVVLTVVWFGNLVMGAWATFQAVGFPATMAVTVCYGVLTVIVLTLRKTT